jgi:hypothetical protein
LFHENCRFFKVSGITKTGSSLILIFSKNQNDETLPMIIKPKKKGGECKEQNGRTHVQKDKRTT